ncbi:hypothetical protein B0A62_22415 [Flavobacterium hydatis]|uniref:Uncharacterized protein n=1 Tax=Flavobacterium hydatis TaxID=991 RepID=A0A086ADZ1_FLAHY|nr:hypothetical protein IW20_16540 [Flavobacterium hydatis]OXA87761.1 hypothetical protein B0A62_22415 [Flavobacterium hydatis]
MGVSLRVGLFVSIFCFLKEKTKGFSLQSLTQNNFCDKNKSNDLCTQEVCVQKIDFYNKMKLYFKNRKVIDVQIHKKKC